MTDEALNICGLAEAAEILGVETTRIIKWRKLGVVLPDGRRVGFPEPVIVLRATPVWQGDDIRALADALAEPVPPLRPFSSGEV